MQLVYKTSLGKTKTVDISKPDAKKTALSIAAISVVPLMAFAVLWSSLLLILGGMWLLSLLGLV